MNIKDIAKLSGVGVSTVSRVLNNRPDVNTETRKKVLEIIKESNYIPNNSARILKQNNTTNIGVLVKGVFNPFFSAMLNVIGSAIDKSKYTMILQNNDYTFDEDFDTLQSFIKEKKLQGAICLGGNFETVTKENMNSLEVPVILTSVNSDLSADEGDYSSIGIDNMESAYKATKYLLDLGHKEIAIVIGEKNDLGISWNRLKGYRKAVEEAGIAFDTDKVLIGDYNAETSYNVTKDYLTKNKDITAIFSFSDLMAIGVGKAIADLGLIIGEDISLVGFDGMDESKFYIPGITTVKQPKKQMAKKSIDLLFGILSGEETHKHIILDTELIKRDSCKKNKNN